MCWAFDLLDRARGRVLSIAVLSVCVPAAFPVLASPPPDSLTVKQMQTINKLAEVRLKDYIWALKAMAELTDSDDDALLAKDYITDHITGDQRLFYKAETTIEDNVDPSLAPGTSGLNRLVDAYFNALRLHFRMEGDAVEYKLLMRGEPKSDAVVHTQLLYEMRFIGTHTDRPGVAYTMQKRVMELILQLKPDGKWVVWVAGDRYYDPAQPFAQFHVDRQLEEATATGAAETPELAAFKEAQREAQALVDDELAKRKKAYEGAIKAGQDAVADGDFEAAIAYFGEARTFDPLLIEPRVLADKAKKAKQAKELADKKNFDLLQDKGRKLTELREYQRALDSYQSAAVIYPEDHRNDPLIESLEAKVKAKAERERFFDTPDYPKSVTACQELLKDPAYKDDVEVLTLLARSLAAQGPKKHDEALRYLGKVIEKEPHYAEALRARADILEGRGPEGIRSAMQDCGVLKTFDQWDMRNHHRYARLLCEKEKRCRDALVVLKDALKLEPGNKETMYQLARVNSIDALKDYPVALQQLDDALRIDSTCAECWLERGIVLLQMDDVPTAEGAIALARSLSLAPWSAARADSMSAFNLRQAKSLEASGGYEDADRSFLRACVLKPTDPGLRFAKAKNLMRMEKWNEAIADLDLHIARTDGPYQALLDRAACKLRLGKDAEALADVREILNNHIEKFAAYANLVAGQAAYNMNEFSGAEAYLKEALNLDLPDNPEADPKDRDNRLKNAKASRYMALICLKGSRKKEAKKYAKDAVDLEPTNKENHMNLGLALQAIEDWSGSIAAFDMALAKGADRSDVYKLIGRSHMLAGDQKKALEQFAEQKPLRDDKDVFTWTAECLLEQEQYAPALSELNLLLTKFPEVESDPEFLARIGYLYVITGNVNTAKEYFDKAVAVDNKNKSALFYRSTYYWKNDQQNEAVTQLGELVRRGIILESDLKKKPILEDILDSKLWKDRAK